MNRACHTVLIWIIALEIYLRFFSNTTLATSQKLSVTKTDKKKTPAILLIWAIKLTDEIPENELLQVSNQIAQELDLHHIGQVGELGRHFVLTYLPPKAKDDLLLHHVKKGGDFKLSHSDLNDVHQQHVSEEHHSELSLKITSQLSKHNFVEWAEQQVVRSRQKRQGYKAFKDPLFPKQWHLVNDLKNDMDINVTGVWSLNVTGRGATVAIVDDGLEWTNPDILPNYSAEGSWDLNSEDSDPMPSGEKVQNHHGTRCAGEVAAAVNNFCGVGVAYGSKVSGLRVLDGPMTDSLEATAFTKNMDVNDIYSCSWGPDDDGKTVDGPHKLARKALRHGVDFGRKGYGSVYVVASGNGGEHQDNCNYDGYANSMYTITIGAVDETGRMPYYGEECSSMLAVTFSSGDRRNGRRSIVTTDWRKDGGTGCTSGHTGTSAAAPLAAGMIALMLEVRHCLSWRDIQYLIILTALKIDINIGGWARTGSGLHHSLQHGFGLMKAWRLVNAAKVWEPVPWMTSYTSEVFTPLITIPSAHKPLILNTTVSEVMLIGFDLRILEQVQVIITLSHWRRGNLEIRLKSPHGTESLLGAARPKDKSNEGLTDWVFTTVRCWGEEPVGNWKLIVSDKSSPGSPEGVLKKWQLRLYGSPMSSEEFQSRRRRIEEAMSGEFLNDSYTLPCPPPLVNSLPDKPVLSEKTLKILLLSGAFFVFMALYETMEYAMCYNDEKKEHKKMLLLSARAQRLARHHNGATYYQISGDQDTAIGMEEDSIAMETFPQRHLVAENEGDNSDCDIIYSAEDPIHNSQQIDQDFPEDILKTLSPEEIRVNLNFNSSEQTNKKSLPEGNESDFVSGSLSSIDCDNADVHTCLLPDNKENT